MVLARRGKLSRHERASTAEIRRVLGRERALSFNILLRLCARGGHTVKEGGIGEDLEMGGERACMIF